MLEILLLLAASLIYLSVASAGEINIQLLFCAAFVLLLVVVPIIIHLLLLLKANATVPAHRHLLARLACIVRRKISLALSATLSSPLSPLAAPDASSATAAAKCALLQESAEQMESVNRFLAVEQEARALTLLFYIPATPSFLSSLLAGSGVVAGFIFSLLSDKVVSQYSYYWASITASAAINGTASVAAPTNATLSAAAALHGSCVSATQLQSQASTALVACVLAVSGVGVALSFYSPLAKCLTPLVRRCGGDRDMQLKTSSADVSGDVAVGLQATTSGVAQNGRL